MALFKKNKKISVSVFCGSRNGKSKEYLNLAKHTGELLAKNNMRLVYGAGGKGLMGAVANGVIENNGEIYGVTTEVIAAFEQPIAGTKTKIVKTLQDRKELFIKNSNAFIILPGGFGTFDELFDLLVGKEIYDKHKEVVPGSRLSETRPIILINKNKFFTPFVNLVDSIIKEGFMHQQNKKMYKLVDTPEEAIKIIKNYMKK